MKNWKVVTIKCKCGEVFTAVAWRFTPNWALVCPKCGKRRKKQYAKVAENG